MHSSRRSRFLPWASATLAVIVTSFVWVTHASADQKTVLVLYATRSDARISVMGDRELPRRLERGLGQRVNHFSEHLDLARFPDAQYRTAIADFLHLKYGQHQLDLVIAMHEMVLDFLGPTRQTLFRDTPIVFFTNTANTPRLPNSTGIVDEHDFAPSVAVALALQPQVRRVYVVTGADRADQIFERRARTQLAQFEPRVAITYLSGLATSDLKTRLSTLPADSIIYYLVVSRDGVGERFHPLEYLQDIAQVANAPIYTWVDSGMDQGIVGGSLKSQLRQTEVIAELALRVLTGEAPESIPTRSMDLRVDQVDSRQLRRWGISESRVPAGTLIMFKDATLWDRYKVYVVVTMLLVAAQGLLITRLLVQSRRRRRAEEQVRKSQSKLQASYDRIRRLGMRLLNAQEDERARIARELHDDVGQQLALLATDVELLRSGLASEPIAVAGQAWGRLQTVARSVHDLAHGLYPAKLRLIGLVPALQALQRELERSVIVMNFVHEHVPRSLPPEVTLCVFRVVQEALKNALKYSAAREVALSLKGTPAGLMVTIADDGTGFDVGAAWGKGLGLVSMSERLEAMNGTFEIHSSPGAGTRIVFTVPLAAGARMAAAG